MKKDLKTFLKILLIGYTIVLAVNLSVNYQYYSAGNDWKFSVFFSIGATTLGCIGGMIMYKISLRGADRKKPQFNLLLTVLASSLYGIVLMLAIMKGLVVFGNANDWPRSEYVINCIWSALFSMLICLIIAGQEFLKRLKKSMLENEQMKQEMLRSQYEALKNQVNPHFLFNSLNTLTVIIPERPDVAVDFVQKLSKVFRYSLEYSGENTIDLGTELKIVESYLFLNKQRFDGKLISEISIDDTANQKQIITQSLLMLVENAIKHNEISNQKPLIISIYNEGDILIIKNTLQLKTIPEPSTHIGIENIKNRYKLVSDMLVSVTEENNWFIVKLPLLSK